MAFSTLNLKHPEYEVIKHAPVDSHGPYLFQLHLPLRGTEVGIVMLVAAL